MNTPTPAQALGDLEEVARDRFRNGDQYSAAILRRCGQHFAVIEADLSKAYEIAASHADRADAAEARVLELLEIESTLDNSAQAMTDMRRRLREAEWLLRDALAYLPPIDHQDQTRQRIAAFLAANGEL